MLTLVLVTHNSASWLPGMAESWHRAAADAARQPRVIIADSGSTDDSQSLAARLFPKAHTLSCENIGYGAAANLAFEEVQTPWVLLCNPDIIFPPDFLSRVAESPRLHEPGVACIAPRLLNADGTLQPSIGTWPTARALVFDQLRKRDHRKYLARQPVTEQRIPWASGACLLLNMEALADVQGFDNRFFLYVEEVDLLKRLADRGWETWFSPQLYVTHLNPYATRPPDPQTARYAARGNLRYFAKHASFATLWAYRKLAFLSGRLPFTEAFATRSAILQKPTGP